MEVKTKKWSLWQPAVTEIRKYSVVVKPMTLERLLLSSSDSAGGGSGRSEKAVEIKMRWKGGEVKSGFVPPFHRGGSRRYTECSGERFVKKEKPVTWDDEFQKVCHFSVVCKDGDNKFLPWDVSFKLQYGNYRGKKTEIGKASLNLAGILSKESLVVTKLPLDLHIAGTTRQATLSVLVIFMEIGDCQEPALLVRNSFWFGGMGRNEVVANMMKSGMSSSDSNESIMSTESRSTTDSHSSSSSGSDIPLGTVKKLGFFSWKRRRVSFRVDHTKIEPLASSGPLQADNQTVPDAQQKHIENDPTGNWEAKELTSRDGKTKLNTNIFFASFDQCSNKAAGESACTALVAVIAHWFLSNKNSIPTKKEFENLIIEGSSEWRKLCENQDYVTQFPNKHFDLETVIRAGIRPVAVLPEKSFVGFFSPEKFEVVKGAMSFDEIWDEIGKGTGLGSKIYLVSWNDHFFVLKADEDAYYIIDTLGERLFEACTQAYILRFDDDSSLIVGGNTEEEKKETYTGKDCCREFIKRFLAAIPIGELELDEEKAAVPYYSLHHRLQIEFNFSTNLPESTSLITST